MVEGKEKEAALAAVAEVVGSTPARSISFCERFTVLNYVCF